ncbi:tetratricopeptide repeat protein [Aequorivita xiaoshiensis]|uniref:Tetratricopeptide repeat protein n=1 Tax=Aequorivita xiaoshiensis TaxID=2874476 RepID=A0A9X1R5E0_9FLAO|nr:hypothetical protein [Aequorivita xiaoshiensis]MCG2432052.1 hypothetical protein [Aequorivita xiaoshiensis]
MHSSKSLFILTIICITCCFVIPQIGIAQSQKEFAKELEEANLNVYQDAAKAVALSTEVYQKAELLETKIYALITMVNGYTALNENGKSLQFASKTWELAKSSGNVQYKIWALGVLAEQYQLSHLNAISREYLDRAENLLESSDLSKEALAVSRGNIYAIKGNGYKDEIDCEYAIKNYNLSIASYQTMPENSVSVNNLALVFLEKGNCLLDLNKLKQAKTNFKKAYSIAIQNELEEYKHWANIGLAKIASQEGNYVAAKDSVAQILNTIDTTQNPKTKTELYLLLKENFLALGDKSNYELYRKKYSNSAKEIEILEERQFENVLQFVEEQPLDTGKSLKVLDYILYGLLVIAMIVSVWQLWIWVKNK